MAAQRQKHESSNTPDYTWFHPRYGFRFSSNSGKRRSKRRARSLQWSCQRRPICFSQAHGDGFGSSCNRTTRTDRSVSSSINVCCNFRSSWKRRNCSTQETNVKSYGERCNLC